jgi:hypothetical protein
VINRFSVGTKNKDLKLAADGSLTIYVQGDEPKDPVQRDNWLPAPKVTSRSSFALTGQSREQLTERGCLQQRRKRNEASSSAASA